MKFFAFALVLVACHVSYSEAHIMKLIKSGGVDDGLVINRHDNFVTKTLTHIYKSVHFFSNGMIIILNILLAISNSWCIRMIQNIIHFLLFPVRVICGIGHILTTPLRVLFYPITFILQLLGARLTTLPSRLLNIASYTVRLFLGKRTTPYPRLPEVEFFYTT